MDCHEANASRNDGNKVFSYDFILDCHDSAFAESRNDEAGAFLWIATKILTDFLAMTIQPLTIFARKSARANKVCVA